MTSLVQLMHTSRGRRSGLVRGGRLILIEGAADIWTLANLALEQDVRLIDLAQERAAGESLSYDSVLAGESGWTLLPAIDHPLEPSHCLVTGTGLTHRASADNRQAMHAAGEKPTDSMLMYQWGVEKGRPAAGEIGVAPEWFYKGDGGILRAHGQPLEMPEFAEDGGEESEIAGIYLIDKLGMPRRIGMAQGNEFSDHVCEKKNYLYLAASKLRQCAIGPELVLDPDFDNVQGTARILRGEAVVWEKPIRSGQSHMCHSLENIEHHHFKFSEHRRPGDVHVHFFGASAFSFGDKFKLLEGDVMEVSFEGFGRPLRNGLMVSKKPVVLMHAQAI
jgi:hypothetical protein